MNEKRMMEIIIGPIISEKSTQMSDSDQQIAFRVSKDAQKLEIKKAIENLFEVKVKKIWTMNVKGKAKTFRRKIGYRPDWKKAYVSLEEGNDVDFLGLER